MSCISSVTRSVCLEIVPDVLTGTIVRQTISCDACTSTTPFIDEEGLHLFASLDVTYTVEITDTFEVMCSLESITTPASPMSLKISKK